MEFSSNRSTPPATPGAGPDDPEHRRMHGIAPLDGVAAHHKAFATPPGDLRPVRAPSLA